MSCISQHTEVTIDAGSFVGDGKHESWIELHIAAERGDLPVL
jgi:hypothetical protein